MKAHKGTTGIILGIFLIVGGVLLVAFPKAGFVPRENLNESGWFSSSQEGAGDWMSKSQCRIYGVIGIIFGAGFIWVARWHRWGSRDAAIDDYVWRLSQDLAWNFGNKNHYSIEEVSEAARHCSYKMAYIAYAHAMFCSRADFNEYYVPLHVRCTYDGLRAIIRRRYFAETYNFDANSIVRLATPPDELEYNFNEGFF